jgi:hypothetical protein
MALGVAAVLALSVVLAVRAKIRDEGARSVAFAMDAAFGERGWTADAISFDVDTREFTARDVRISLPGWAYPGGGPLEAELLTVKGPPLPMALKALAKRGFRAEGGDAMTLFDSLELRGVKFVFSRGNVRHRAETASLTVRGVSLDPSALRADSSGVPGEFMSLAVKDALISDLAMFRERDSRPYARARALSIRAPSLLSGRPPAGAEADDGRAAGPAGLLAAQETSACGITVDFTGFSLKLDSLMISGPLYGASRAWSSLRRESASGLRLDFDVPRGIEPAGPTAEDEDSLSRRENSDGPEIAGDPGIDVSPDNAGTPAGQGAPEPALVDRASPDIQGGRMPSPENATRLSSDASLAAEPSEHAFPASRDSRAWPQDSGPSAALPSAERSESIEPTVPATRETDAGHEDATRSAACPPVDPVDAETPADGTGVSGAAENSRLPIDRAEPTESTESTAASDPSAKPVAEAPDGSSVTDDRPVPETMPVPEIRPVPEAIPVREGPRMPEAPPFHIVPAALTIPQDRHVPGPHCVPSAPPVRIIPAALTVPREGHVPQEQHVPAPSPFRITPTTSLFRSTPVALTVSEAPELQVPLPDPPAPANPEDPVASNAPLRLTLSLDSLEVRGGDLFRALTDLRGFLQKIPYDDPVSAVPLSVALMPPFSLESLDAEAMDLAADGKSVLSLSRARVTGPLAEGSPAPVQKAELYGIKTAALPLPFEAPCPSAPHADDNLPPLAEGSRSPQSVSPSTARDGSPEPPEIPDEGCPAGADASWEIRYDAGLGTLAVPEFALEAEGLFSLRARLALARTGPELLEELKAEPLLRPAGIFARPAFGDAGIASVTIEYSDGGFVRRFVAGEIRDPATDPLPDTPLSGEGRADALEAYARRIGVLALYRLDPFVLNAREFADEIARFAADPRELALSIAAEEPLRLGSVGPGLLAPLSGEEEQSGLRAAMKFLSPLKATLSVNGMPELAARWREVPPAFMGGAEPSGSSGGADSLY